VFSVFLCVYIFALTLYKLCAGVHLYRLKTSEWKERKKSEKKVRCLSPVFLYKYIYIRNMYVYNIKEVQFSGRLSCSMRGPLCDAYVYIFIYTHIHSARFSIQFLSPIAVHHGLYISILYLSRVYYPPVWRMRNRPIQRSPRRIKHDDDDLAK